MLSAENFKKAFNLTIPVLFGYVAIGIPFGMTVINADYQWWMVLLTGLLIFSGTAQYTAILYFTLFGQFNGSLILFLPALLLVEFFISLRHSFYGISLIDKFKNLGKLKMLLIYGLSDETYSILCSAEVPEGADKGVFYAVISVLNQSYWIIGGLIGAALASILPNGMTDGVDFSLVCLFAVLMIDQIKKTEDKIPSVIGVACTVTAIILAYIPTGGTTINGKPAHILPSENIILVGLVLGLAVITFIRGIRNKEIQNLKTEEDK